MITVPTAPRQMTSFKGSQFVQFGKKFAMSQSAAIKDPVRPGRIV
jgi:hypothetical protein